MERQIDPRLSRFKAYLDGKSDEQRTYCKDEGERRRNLGLLERAGQVYQEIIDNPALSSPLYGSVPLKELDLWVGTYNPLDRAGIKTIGELTRLSEEDVRKIKGIGNTKLRDIKRQLEDRGLSLRVE